MSATLSYNEYGKSGIRLTKVRRLADRHELIEMTISIRLTGAFEHSYLTGDNTDVVATDSMKNTVYLLAKHHSAESPEAFAVHVARHFISKYPQVASATVSADQSSWERLHVDGSPHPTAFRLNGTEIRLARATVSREQSQSAVYGGIAELLLLKTTDSAFVGFVRDEFTSLPEVTDRILATKLRAEWTYVGLDLDFNSAYAKIRGTMLDTFAHHKSDAVQQTQYDMGAAALAAEPSISGINLRMPNKHRIPFNFKPFGQEFANDIYVTTDEPSGEIVAQLSRAR